VVRKHHLRWIYMNKDFEVSVRLAEESTGAGSPASRRLFEQLGRTMQRSMEQVNSPQMRANLSKSEEMQADTDGAVLAWRAGYEAWGLAAVMQRFEAASRLRYVSDEALAWHPEPLQRFKLLDLALRSLAETETLGEVGAQRYLDAVRGVRERRS
jgi:predicted Zn-dependent protease